MKFMNELPIDVDNLKWSKQVREIKIRELKDLIDSTDKNNPRRVVLEEKLEILETP